MLEDSTQKEEKELSLGDALKLFVRMVRIMRPYWSSILRGILLSLGIGFFGLLPPLISKQYFDRVLPAEDASLIIVLVAATFAFSSANALMAAVRGVYSASVSMQFVRAVNLMFFNHIQHLPARFFEHNRVGEITSRFGNATSSAQAVSSVFETIVLNISFLLLAPPLLLYMNTKLALLSVISIPLTTLLSTIASRSVRRLSRRSTEVNAELSASQVEAFVHIRLVKGLAAEPYILMRVREKLQETMALQLRSITLSASLGVANSLFRGAGAALFTYVAWNQILQEKITLGAFMAFSMYLGYLSGPVSALSSLFMDLQTTAISLNRFFEYLDQPTEQRSETAFQQRVAVRDPLTGSIQFETVTFGYHNDKAVLAEASFLIAEGEKVAIVGPSGAGKSTILKLLTRHESPQSGRILIGSRSIDSIALSDLRRQVSVVWQDSSLVRGSIRENLLFGIDQAVDEENLSAALKIASLDSVVSEMKHGLDTTIAEWGATLSAGQRQRVALARSVLRRTPILLLDEATANIDIPTEAKILRGILEQRSSQTVLFATHRMASAMLADRVLVVEHNGSVSFGTHEQLLADSHAYRNLVVPPQREVGHSNMSASKSAVPPECES
jgi:ABC-type bacteriocin/lantibiotic exporter with double-glycine peptidase domain